MAAALGVFNFVGVVVLSYLCGQPQIIAENRELSPRCSVSSGAESARRLAAIRCGRSSSGGKTRESTNGTSAGWRRAQVARPGKLLRRRWTPRGAAAGQGASSEEETTPSSPRPNRRATEAEEFERKLKERAGE